MAPTSRHMHDIIYIYKMSRKKPQKLTYSQVLNTHYYQWDNCVMMTAPPFFPNIIAQYTTKTTNQASKITPKDYMNNIFLHQTKTLSTRQTPPYQQPTYRNTSNTFTNVLSPQPPEHGSKLLKRATSKHGPVSPSRLSNNTYQNQKQQYLDIWTNKKTCNQRNKVRMTKKQCTHHPHSNKDSAHMLFMPLPSATMNRLENYTPT